MTQLNGLAPMLSPSASQSARMACRVVVFGRVQGVWYRASLQDVATRLKVSGGCRNQPDGTVEAWLVGPATQVEQVIAWCHQGPPNAQVSQVTVEPWADNDERLNQLSDTFEVWR